MAAAVLNICILIKIVRGGQKLIEYCWITIYHHSICTLLDFFLSNPTRNLKTRCCYSSFGVALSRRAAIMSLRHRDGTPLLGVDLPT